MSFKMIKQILTILILTVLLASSCKKYDEGPRFSLYSKTGRISGNWYFSKAYYNDIDSTENYYKYSLNFIKDGRLSMVETSNDNIYISYILGDWEFLNNKMNLEMTLLNDTDTIYHFNWLIKRLSYYDLWLEYTDSNDNNYRWELMKPM